MNILRCGEEQHGGLDLPHDQLSCHDKAVAAVVTLATADGYFEFAQVRKVRLQNTNKPASGILHEQKTGDAIAFGGQSIHLAHLLSGQNFHLVGLPRSPGTPAQRPHSGVAILAEEEGESRQIALLISANLPLGPSCGKIPPPFKSALTREYLANLGKVFSHSSRARGSALRCSVQSKPAKNHCGGSQGPGPRFLANGESRCRGGWNRMRCPHPLERTGL